MATGPEMMMEAAMKTVFKLMGVDAGDAKARMTAVATEVQSRAATFEQTQSDLVTAVRELGAIVKDQAGTIAMLKANAGASALETAARRNVENQAPGGGILKDAINTSVYEDYIHETAGDAAFGRALDMLDDAGNIGFGAPPSEAASATEG